MELARSLEFDRLWSTADARSASSLESVEEAPQEEALGWSHSSLESMLLEDSLVPECAQGLEDDLIELHELAAPAAPIFRQKLSARSLRFRMVCAAGPVIWFLALEFIAVTRVYGKAAAQVVLHTSILVVGCSVAAASFPSNLASQQRFTLLPTIITTLSVVAASFLDSRAARRLTSTRVPTGSLGTLPRHSLRVGLGGHLFIPTAVLMVPCARRALRRGRRLPLGNGRVSLVWATPKLSPRQRPL